MKLRIKGNSIRLRLSKTEVATLCADGVLREQTDFAETSFVYVLMKSGEQKNIEATFTGHQLTVFVPGSMLEGWPQNQVVSLDNRLPDGAVPSLYILIEKDFKCIDNTIEDQSDNYDHPTIC